jgi:purine-binding chemotaxis protein CheW
MSGLYVRVRVGAEAYALPVEHVVEVSELGNVTPMPGTSAATLGVCNLRGEVIPVYDLARVMGLPRETLAARLLVAEDRGERVGLAIDDVTDVGQLPSELQDADAGLLVGASLADGLLVGVIDVERLFAALDREAA